MNDDQTVFLVDADPAIQESLTLILASSGHRVRGFVTASGFIEACGPDTPGCLVLDLHLPDMSGLELQARLLEGNIRIPIIFISACGDIQTAVCALRNGALDFIEKPVDTERLLQRVEEAVELDRCRRAAAETERAVLARFRQLTPREQEVLLLTTRGLTNKDIARQLGISPRTVENHRARMMEKMGAANLAELCRLASICEPRR
ncbi:response regulator transcription factor [Caldichromatium japonicum]|uniref:Response regulator transcription factor n=1 Tax=Caldichromatium japonicum TaxID=2699430 RepID=A0A6G7VE02_9GAMM|nr:response regulator [Caldichromatium japonicum]QIK38078.1 response regulator transcription factor [Caldichromatium japonicum]